METLETASKQRTVTRSDSMISLKLQENYIEYSRTGQIIKGAEKKIIRSKYEEDVFVNNHTTVWGSYWENFKWGYKCCHSFVKQSYCTGSTGKLVRECSANIVNKARSDPDDSQSSQDQDTAQNEAHFAKRHGTPRV